MAKDKTIVKVAAKPNSKNLAGRMAASNPISSATEKLAGFLTKKRKK